MQRPTATSTRHTSCMLVARLSALGCLLSHQNMQSESRGHHTGGALCSAMLAAQAARHAGAQWASVGTSTSRQCACWGLSLGLGRTAASAHAGAPRDPAARQAARAAPYRGAAQPARQIAAASVHRPTLCLPQGCLAPGHPKPWCFPLLPRLRLCRLVRGGTRWDPPSPFCPARRQQTR